MKQFLPTLYLLSFSLVAVSSSAQPLSKQDESRLDLRLRSVLPEDVGARPVAPRPPATYRGADGSDLFGVVIHTDDVAALRRKGVKVNSEHSTFATAVVSARQLAELARTPGVRYVDAGDRRYPENDVAAGLVGASLLHNGVVGGTEYRGDGVIVCVYDSGIDFTHEDFRDPVDQTQSRILYIWDQTLTPSGAEASPSGFGYGVEYSNADIEDELDGSPAGFVRQVDSNGHGTHVAGTAAGNGSSLSPAQYAGMAPNADLIVIKGGNDSFPTTGIIDGFDYCDGKATAAGKPAVMNLSLGSDAGPHDGTDVESVAADAFSSGSGRVAVYSAGNSGDDLIHTSGTVSSSSTESFTFTVPSYPVAPGAGNDDFGFEVWFDTAGDVTVTVDSPNITGAAVFGPGVSTGFSTADGTIVGDNSVDGGNGDRNFWVYVYDSDQAVTPEPGTWTIHVENTSGASMGYHGWQYDRRIGSSGAIVTLTGADSDYTLSTSSANAIIVASYVHRWRWESESTCCYAYSLSTDRSDNISSFSSAGPTRDGRQKPDIAAPGQGMVSSLSKDVGLPSNHSSYIAGGRHYLTQGTSMSSPVVAGAVALLLQADPTLTASEIASLLEGSADTDGFTGAVWNTRWGSGRLNIFRAMVELVDSGSSGNRQILAYDEWAPGFDPVGLGSGQGVAVRFTPSINGAVEGVFVHTYNATPSGDISFEIWTDVATLPGSQIGSTVTVPGSLMSDATWRYIDLAAVGASVTAGTDYHLVVLNSGTTVAFEQESASVDGRSSANAGTGWFAYGSDWRIRPVVADGIVSLPVELATFQAITDEQDIVVRWQTASETDNAGFGIEMMEAGTDADYREVAFVNGAGTSSDLRNYEHRISGIGPASYQVRLRSVALDGTFEYSPEVEVKVGVASDFYLQAPYPNPFNPRTSMRLAVARDQHVRIDVYDVTGRRVSTLLDDRLAEGLSRTIELDGSLLATGLYFVDIRGEHFARTEKVVLLK